MTVLGFDTSTPASSACVLTGGGEHFEIVPPADELLGPPGHARELMPDECIPKAGSVAQLGPSAGSMLLFRLPLENTENRPLELELQGQGEDHLTFKLDI